MTVEEKNKEEFKSNHPILKKIVISILIITTLLFGYMRFWNHSFITINETQIVEENLPSYFNGFKIVQFSDIYFGITTNESEIEKVVEKINLTNPDIVVFTGDLLDKKINLSDSAKDFLKNTLSKINATHKKLAIIGDNDNQNLDVYKDIMMNSGFKILDQENELIFLEGTTPILIAGISSLQKEYPNLEETLKTDISNVSYKILIAHEPQIIDELGNNKINLILSGHSLGGLIRLPYTNGLIKKEGTKEYQKGFYQVDSTKLYVSSGIGTENINLRLFNSPEINLYRFYNYY